MKGPKYLKKSSQHFSIDQRCFNVVDNETKSDDGFSTLQNVDTASVSDVETTLKQRWYNFISKLFQRCLNVSKSYFETYEASDRNIFADR